MHNLDVLWTDQEEAPYDSKEAAEGCLFAAKYMCGFGS